MNFKFKLAELQYIKSKFGIEQLLGIENAEGEIPDCSKSLTEAGVIFENSSGHLDLTNTYRYLFSSWVNMRYSLIRPDELLDEEEENDAFFAVLANEKEIILINQLGEDLAVELIDFNPDIMDKIILNMAPFDVSIKSEYSLNLTLSSDEFMKLMTACGNGEWEKCASQLGIPMDELLYFFDVITEEEDDGFMFLCEDHVGDAGYLIRIVNAPRGVCALKHVTLNEKKEERVTIIIGDAYQVADSIYAI